MQATKLENTCKTRAEWMHDCCRAPAVGRGTAKTAECKRGTRQKPTCNVIPGAARLKQGGRVWPTKKLEPKWLRNHMQYRFFFFRGSTKMHDMCFVFVAWWSRKPRLATKLPKKDRTTHRTHPHDHNLLHILLSTDLHTRECAVQEGTWHSCRKAMTSFQRLCQPS